jgi:hypothetical protein
LSKTFLILIIIQRDIVINVKTSSCKVSVILVILELNLSFLDRFSGGGGGGESANIKLQQKTARDSRIVSCGRTDMTKLIGAFRNFAKSA